MADYLIWWTPDYDINALRLTPGIPPYIRREVHQRLGRVGRGRLWVPKGIPVEQMEDCDKAPTGCGGIVFHATDFFAVAQLKIGFVTDLSGERIASWP